MTNKRRLLAIGAIGVVLLVALLGEGERASATTFTAVSSGQAHTCALASPGGALQCWGWNETGALGIGTVTPPYDKSAVPLPVCASGVWNGASCAGGSPFTGVYGISQGSMANHTCATVAWGILDCWGWNYSGQVGNGTSGNLVLNPTTVQCAGASAYCNSTYHFLSGIVAVATGLNHTCALDAGGYVWCWGSNYSGELGDGTTTARNIATRVCASGSGQDCPNGTLLSGVTAIAVGEAFSCALTAAGGVKCWGSNDYYQLGDGIPPPSDRSLPGDVVGLTSGVASLSASALHACAVLTGGGVKCWGFNSDGQLGDGTLDSRLTPVSVCASGSWNGTTCSGGSALTGVSNVSAGAGHSCVLTTAAPYVKCWGTQWFGTLGNSVSLTPTSALNPVSWTTPSWGQPQPSALSAGGIHTCAIVSTYVECWGWNTFGQVGNGTTYDTNTWISQDVDKDGCADSQELGPNHTAGGQRDPTNFWDFFDTPNDSRTTLSTSIGVSSPTLPAWITVASTSGFPAATPTNPITLYIDNEKFQYDGLNSTQFHIIARALDGTVAAAHNAGAAVVSNWRDKIVNNDDVNRVTARYGSSGDPTIDPLSAPPASGYHTAFDRTYVGPNQWNLGPPDGQISSADILYVTRQVGDSCQ